MKMKLLVASLFVTMIQFAWSVNPQDVFDELSECGVAWAEDSIDCVLSKVNLKMDIDLEKAINTLQICGFTIGDDSIECLKNVVIGA